MSVPVLSIVQMLKMQYDGTRDHRVHIPSALSAPVRTVQCHREEYPVHMLIIMLRLVDSLAQY